MPHKDPNARKAYYAKYNANRREKAKLRTAEWRESNPGRNAESAKLWRQKNAEKAKVKQREYREKNREIIRKKQKEWRDRTGYNRSEKRIAYTRDQQLRTHGLTRQDYEELLAKQGGCCAICGNSEPGVKSAARLYVDHCHQTDRVRGLLCGLCNAMLGYARDKPNILRMGAIYLERDYSCSPIRSEKRRILGSA